MMVIKVGGGGGEEGGVETPSASIIKEGPTCRLNMQFT
jgi:hypothetical protein